MMVAILLFGAISSFELNNQGARKCYYFTIIETCTIYTACIHVLLVILKIASSNKVLHINYQ